MIVEVPAEVEEVLGEEAVEVAEACKDCGPKTEVVIVFLSSVLNPDADPA